MKLQSLIPSLLILGCTSFPKISMAEMESQVNNRYTTTVTREVLVSGQPSGAEGRLLELVKYTIAPGAALPIHFHPGMQMERVEFGVLTYTVVEGIAYVTRADGTAEVLEAGQTTLLQAGDALVEPEGMIHFAKNETPNIVILLATSLFEEDQPKAILTEEQSTK